MSMWKMSRFLGRTAVLTAAMGGLTMQGGAPWVAVDPGPAVHADLRGVTLLDASGYQIYFKNFGKSTLHFGFYLEGIQTANSVSTNRRIHLKPGNLVGPLSLKPEPGVKGTIRLRAVALVEGDKDSTAS